MESGWRRTDGVLRDSARVRLDEAVTAQLGDPERVRSFLELFGRPARPIVVDANRLRGEIRALAQNRCDTALVTLAKAGFLRLFVAPHVLEEVEEHVEDWAGETRTPPAAMGCYARLPLSWEAPERRRWTRLHPQWGADPTERVRPLVAPCRTCGACPVGTGFHALRHYYASLLIPPRRERQDRSGPAGPRKRIGNVGHVFTPVAGLRRPDP